MTLRPRPARESLILAALDLALTDVVETRVDDGDRAGVLELLLEAAGVPAVIDPVYSRRGIAEDLVERGLILDEADGMGLDGPLLRARLGDAGTTAQREAELDHVRVAFGVLVRTTVESLPPSTIRRP